MASPDPTVHRSTGGDAPTVTRVPGAGLALAADVYGDPAAPPVVLLHGGGQTRHAWGTTARTLAASGWRVISADQRGHGDSEWSPDGNYTLDAFRDDVLALADWCGQPPALVGASLGGISALTAVGETEGTVAAALVLVDVAPRVEAKGIERIGTFMTANPDGFASLEEVADAVASYAPHRPRPKDLSGLRKNVRRRPDGRWVWHWDPAFLTFGRSPDETKGAAHPDRLDEAARRLRLPTLLVRGRMSDLLSAEGARHLLELVPHATLVDVAGAGHMVAGDRNDAFNDAVVSFLAAQGGL